MSQIVQAAGGVVVDGKEYFLRRGDTLDGLPAAVVKAFEKLDIFTPDADDPSRADVEDRVVAQESPLLIPDVRDASVGQLAAYLDDAKPNAAKTVALAGGDPELAQKVIDAEQQAHGGDGRSTVIGALEKLRDTE